VQLGQYGSARGGGDRICRARKSGRLARHGRSGRKGIVVGAVWVPAFVELRREKGRGLILQWASSCPVTLID
jgi:hypothetical protein